MDLQGGDNSARGPVARGKGGFLQRSDSPDAAVVFCGERDGAGNSVFVRQRQKVKIYSTGVVT